MPTTPPCTLNPVGLTAHPLQRVGAYALTVLAGAPGGPETLTWADIERATDRMTDDLLGTTHLASAKDPGGYWLAVSYALWPNSPLNPSNRGRLTPMQRAAKIREWRSYPRTGHLDGVPCRYCAAPAVGWYGKTNIPLAPSINHLNTNPPGHQGIALCSGCLASFHALPYGCAWRSGKLHTVHTWDETLLAALVTKRVQQTLARAAGETTASNPQIAVDALDVLAACDQPTTSQLELMTFTNSNREQDLSVAMLSEPLAEWWRHLAQGPDAQATLEALGVAAGGTTPSERSEKLAFLLFHAPHSLERKAMPLITEELANPDAARSRLSHPATLAALRTLICTLMEE